MDLTSLIIILIFVGIVFFLAGLTVGFSFNKCAPIKYTLSPDDAEQFRITMHNLNEQISELTEQVDSVTSHVKSDIVLTQASDE